MESAKNNSSYRKVKTIINDNKLESDIEYRLVSFNIDNIFCFDMFQGCMK